MAAPAAITAAEVIPDVFSTALSKVGELLNSHDQATSKDGTVPQNIQEQSFDMLSKVNDFKIRFLNAAGVTDSNMADKIFNLLFSSQGGTLTINDIINSGLFEEMGKAVINASTATDPNLAAQDVLNIVYNQLQRTMDPKAVVVLLQRLNYFASNYYIYHIYHYFANNDMANISRDAFIVMAETWGDKSKRSDVVELSQLSYFNSSDQSRQYLAQLQNEKSRRNLLVSKQFMSMSAAELKRDVDTSVNNQLALLYGNLSKVYGTDSAKWLVNTVYDFIRVIGVSNAYVNAGKNVFMNKPVQSSVNKKVMFKKAGIGDFIKGTAVVAGALTVIAGIVGAYMHSQTPPDTATVAPDPNKPKATPTNPVSPTSAPPTAPLATASNFQDIMTKMTYLQNEEANLESNFQMYQQYISSYINQFKSIFQGFSPENACATINPYSASLQKLNDFIKNYKKDLQSYNILLPKAEGYLVVFQQMLKAEPNIQSVSQISAIQQQINKLRTTAFNNKQQLNELEIIAATVPEIMQLIDSASNLCIIQQKLKAAEAMYGLGYPGLALKADSSYSGLKQVISSAINKLKTLSSTAEASADVNMEQLIKSQIMILSKALASIDSQQTINLMNAWKKLAPGSSPGLV